MCVSVVCASVSVYFSVNGHPQISSSTFCVSPFVLLSVSVRYSVSGFRIDCYSAIRGVSLLSFLLHVSLFLHQCSERNHPVLQTVKVYGTALDMPSICCCTCLGQNTCLCSSSQFFMSFCSEEPLGRNTCWVLYKKKKHV